MPRIMGVDYGTKRIGLALSDESATIAFPRETVTIQNPQEGVRRVVELARAWKADQIVVGLPLNMNGTEGPLAHAAREFIAQLQKQLAIPITPWDERLSSRCAENLLIEAGTSRQKRRQVVDKIAAQIILQSYLEAHAPPTP